MTKTLKIIASSLLVCALLVPFVTQAQQPPEAIVRLNTNSIVYTGPSTNAGYLEYVAQNRELIAAARSSNSGWIRINIDQQIEGWIPASNANLVSGNYADLPVLPGLIDTGSGKYDVNNSILRNVEIQMITLRRPMRQIAARWFRLQGFTGASCQNYPPIPPDISITDAQIAQIPELEEIRHQLEWAQYHTEQAILVYQVACEGSQEIVYDFLDRGIGHINNAYDTYDTVRKSMNTITGLESVTR